MNNTLVESFIRYAKIDTQSDPLSDTFPSTAKQKHLLHLLLEELHRLNIDTTIDEYGYVLANIPANIDKKIPCICFVAHVDTSPDCSGQNVQPIIHKNYNGQSLILPNNNIEISPKEFPYLQQLIGHHIITADGTTLLGADDKSGVAIMMQLAKFISQNPHFKHGDIQLLFTPDEEIGKGVDKLDMKKIKAAFGYTLDGGALGHIENENFCADSITLTFEGVMAHPGYAKNKLVNALKIAAQYIAELPTHIGSPETTSQRQGFVHPVMQNGTAEKCVLSFIVRNFTTQGLQDKENTLIDLAQKITAQYTGATCRTVIKNQYRNMKSIIDADPHLVQYAQEAMLRIGITPSIQHIRGGTDGARLSFMGLPCANLFTGMQAIHSYKEFISIQDMEKSFSTIQKIVHLMVEKS